MWIPLALMLAAQPAPSTGESGKIGLAVVNLQTSGEVSPDLAKALSGLMSARLDRAGVFKVITQDEIQQMIAFDEMKTALSCEEDASCLAEIGAALGVPWLLTGSISKIGSKYVLNLTLVHIDQARVESRNSARFDDEDALLEGIDTEVERTVASLLFKEQGAISVLAAEEGSTVAVDGSAIGTTPLEPHKVAAGPHRVTVSREGFIQYEVDVVVRPKETATVQAVLRPSPEYLADYRARTGAVRGAAWGTSVGGAAAVAVGAGSLIWFFARREGLRVEKGVAASADVPVNLAEYSELAATFWGGVTGAVAGAALIGTGAFFFATGEDPTRYDALVE